MQVCICMTPLKFVYFLMLYINQWMVKSLNICGE